MDKLINEVFENCIDLETIEYDNTELERDVKIAMQLYADAYYYQKSGEDKDSSSCEKTGVDDKEGNEISEDDIMLNENGNQFRVYKVAGGFAIKANYWRSDINDLTPTDQLVIQPIADLQTRYWLTQSCIIKCKYCNLER